MFGGRISVQVLWKIAKLAWAFGISFIDYLLTVAWGLGGSGTQRAFLRGVWLQRVCKQVLAVVKVKVYLKGQPPASGVLVSNHLSYTDILVYSSVQPTVFISKAEVAAWPLFGTLAKLAGTLFIQRSVRSDVARVASEMPAVIKSGVLLIFFPEGTSSGGQSVLPFKPSLLAPAAENGWNVTPAFLRYEIDTEEGTVTDDVAYWRDMEFGDHLMNLLQKNSISVTIFYGSTTQAGSDRKLLASHLHGEVSRLGGLVPVKA